MLAFQLVNKQPIDENIVFVRMFWPKTGAIVNAKNVTTAN